MKKYILGTALIVIAGFFTIAATGQPRTTSPSDAESSGKPFEIERFISPEVCSDCHVDISEQWQNSMHNLSHADPIYMDLATYLRKGLVDKGEIAEAESCVKCHTPVGYVSGFPTKLSDDLSRTAEIATQGIQCDYCHSAHALKKHYNNGIMLKPGHGEDDPGVKYGPFDDAEPDFHEARYSRLHTEATICGTCHDVKHVAFGTDLETTYTEWKNSPYNDKDPEKRITCQGCHMYQRPGIPATGSSPRPENPGSATDYSVKRPHIFTHYFVGGNAVVPKVSGDRQKSVMARERLKHAATVSILSPRTNSNKKNSGKIQVSVTNTGAGHCIPTGLGDLRQVWLEIIVKDKENNTGYATGLLDKNGDLSDDALLFHTVFGDENNSPVANVAKARTILKDTRLKAKQTVTHTIDLEKMPGKGTVVTARLLYRSAPAKLLKKIGATAVTQLPVIEMARAEKRF